MAVAAGYTVLAPRTFSKEAWANVKAAGYQPAGQVTPSPKPYAENGRPENVVPETEWTEDMRATVMSAQLHSRMLLGYQCGVKIAREPTVYWAANFGMGTLTLNLGRLGHKWFERSNLEEQLELFLHEFAHDKVSDHLSDKFADEVARLGAKLALMVAGFRAGVATRSPEPQADNPESQQTINTRRSVDSENFALSPKDDLGHRRR
jgi:hypothetical protein